MSNNAVCGARLVDSLRSRENAAEAEAEAKRHFWRTYKKQLAHVTCQRSSHPEGRHHWGTLTWPAPGVDPELPDPEGDALMKDQIERYNERVRKGQDAIRVAMAAAGGRVLP
jgi:hypothetical protein